MRQLRQREKAVLPNPQEAMLLLGEFFQSGGWVLYLILWVSFVMATLILERLGFRLLSYPRLKRETIKNLQMVSHPWLQRGLMCDLELALQSNFALIKNLIALCPLIGLLGTVCGMIQVFDSLSLYGTANPRLMASGVASATFPTMTGMAVAVAGLLFYNRLHRWSEQESKRLHAVFSSDGELKTGGAK